MRCGLWISLLKYVRFQHCHFNVEEITENGNVGKRHYIYMYICVYVCVYFKSDAYSLTVLVVVTSRPTSSDLSLQICYADALSLLSRYRHDS